MRDTSDKPLSLMDNTLAESRNSSSSFRQYKLEKGEGDESKILTINCLLLNYISIYVK